MRRRLVALEGGKARLLFLDLPRDSDEACWLRDSQAEF